MSPVIPHFSSECLELINNKDKVIWPEYNENLIQEDEINIVVQINGKKEIIKTQPNTTEENLIKLIMDNDKLEKYFENKPIKKKSI